MSRLKLLQFNSNQNLELRTTCKTLSPDHSILQALPCAAIFQYISMEIGPNIQQSNSIFTLAVLQFMRNWPKTETFCILNSWALYYVALLHMKPTDQYVKPGPTLEHSTGAILLSDMHTSAMLLQLNWTWTEYFKVKCQLRQATTNCSAICTREVPIVPSINGQATASQNLPSRCQMYLKLELELGCSWLQVLYIWWWQET